MVPSKLGIGDDEFDMTAELEDYISVGSCKGGFYMRT